MSKITVHTTPKNRITINNGKTGEVKSVSATVGVTTLRNLRDVDATSLNNNETVVYDEASDRFVVKELPIVNGGTF